MPQLDIQSMRQKVIDFLTANPSPSDEEFHMFAESMGYDPQTLESVVYQMLGQEVQMDGDSVGEPQPDRPKPSRAVSRLQASSTHFEVGNGGEYGEANSRPGDESDDDCTLFDLANDAPTPEEPAPRVEPTDFPEAPDTQVIKPDTFVPSVEDHEAELETRAVARLIATTKVSEDGGQSDADLANPTRTLQGQGVPAEIFTGDTALQDVMLVDGPRATAALARIKASVNLI